MNAPNTSATGEPRFTKRVFRWVAFGLAGGMGLVFARASGFVPSWPDCSALRKAVANCPEQGTLRDLDEIVAYYRDQGIIPAATRSSAETLLKALEAARPTTSEIESLAARPAVGFHFLRAAADLDKGDYPCGFGVPLEHITHLLRISRFLSVRASAEAAAGRGTAAKADVILTLRLAETIQTEWFINSQHMRCLILQFAISSVWEGIERGCWNDAQLVKIERQLTKINLSPTLRGEAPDWWASRKFTLADKLLGQRGAFSKASENFRRSGELFELMKITNPEPMEPDSFEEYALIALCAVHPRGWIYNNSDFYSRFMQQEKREHNKRPKNISFHLPSRLLPPSILNSKYHFAEVEARLREARVACALERFRLKNGEYPESLDGLVPEFIAVLPDDPMTNRVFHYRRKAAGDFLLWSVGWNGADDGGVPWDRQIKDFDWIWRKAIR